MCVCVCAGITQERIYEVRGAKEMEMLRVLRAQVEGGSDLNAKDEHGATLVRL